MFDASSAEPAPRVLLMGYRTGAGRALIDAGVPFVVWSDREVRFPPPGVAVHVAPFGRDGRESRSLAAALSGAGPFTHVIACTEAAVLPASHARRALDARLSLHTTVRTCHDKLVMKRRLSAAGIPMTDFVDGNEVEDWASLVRRLGSPVVIKDRRASGGSGLEMVDANVKGNVRLRNRIAERFVDAPEASVESFVHHGAVVFENVTEYFRKGHINILPACTVVDGSGRLRALSRQAIENLRISWGVTHLEAYLCPEGPLFGEIALRPPGGYIMELLRLAYGFDAWRAFLAIELGQPFVFPPRASAVAAAIVLHPGAGRIERIRGLAEVRAHPRVVRARLRRLEGETIGARRSVGTDVGHVLLRAPDHATLLEAIEDVESLLRIELNHDG